MTIQEAKEIDMVDYLSQQGQKPAKISGHNYWYHSPFHDERKNTEDEITLVNKKIFYANGRE